MADVARHLDGRLAVLGRLRAFLAGRRRPVVAAAADGLTVTGPSGVRHIGWGDITRVAAFRRDIYLGKVICLAIETADGANVHVTEGDGAYLAVQDGLRKLPGMLSLQDWFPDLAAGRRDVALLYDRGPPGGG